MKGFFDTIPVEIDESARIDGASHVRIFFGMILRLAAPILTVVFFTAFTGMFNELAIAPSSCPTSRTPRWPSGMNSYVCNPLKQEWGFFAAGATHRRGPMLIVFAIAQSQLVTGLTAGASRADRAMQTWVVPGPARWVPAQPHRQNPPLLPSTARAE